MSRKLRDSNKAKRATPKQVARLLRALDPTPKFHTPPRGNYQSICFLVGVQRDGFCFNLDMGLGKTWLTLNLYHYFAKQRGEGGRMLVIVPNAANVEEWREQCSIHTPDLKFSGVYAGVGREDKEAMLWGGRGDVLCLTYNGLLRVVGKAKPGDKNQSFRLDGSRAKRFGSQFAVMMIDESTFIANHTSSFHAACRSVRRGVRRCYTGTGTPFGKSPDELWGQFRVSDQGDTLGESIGLFREAYMYPVDDLYKGTVWHFDRSKKRHLARTVRHGSIRFARKDVMDLPPIVETRVPVVWSKEVWQHHQKIVDELEQAQGNFTLVENAYIRMRGLTAGYLKVIDSEAGEHVIKFKDNAKVEAVVDRVKLVEPKDSQVVVCTYTPTGDIIESRFKDHGIKCLRLYGKTKDKAGLLRRYKQQGGVLLLQWQAGAYGLNLQVANYMHVVEGPTEPKARKQLITRLHRGGQQKTVFVYDYHVKGSVDDKILDALDQGKDLREAIIEGRVRW